MNAKLLLIAVAAGLTLCGCEKPAPPYVSPTAEESFRNAETDQWSYADVGRFVPIQASDKIAILDTKLGNVFYYDFSTKKWAKITSPMASSSYQQPNFFDLIPAQPEKKKSGFTAPPQDLLPSGRP